MERVLVDDLLARDDGRPSISRPTSNEVPPMSVAITLRWPARAASTATPLIPPAGPEPSSRIGRRARVLDVGDAAVGLHHQQPPGEAGVAQPVGEPVEIRDRGGADVRVDHRGDRALVLTLARRGLRRTG